MRKNRYVILPKDFEKAYKKVVKKRDTDFDFDHWNINKLLIKIMDCLFLKLIVSDNSTKKSEITYIEPALIPVRSQNKIKKLE